MRVVCVALVALLYFCTIHTCCCQPTLCFDCFVTNAMMRALDNSLGLSFALTNAASWGSVTMPPAGAGMHVHTHVHTRMLWKLHDCKKRLCSALCSLFSRLRSIAKISCYIQCKRVANRPRLLVDQFVTSVLSCASAGRMCGLFALTDVNGRCSAIVTQYTMTLCAPASLIGWRIASADANDQCGTRLAGDVRLCNILDPEFWF